MATPSSPKKVRIRLSPPPNIYFSKILNSVGNDPLVQVDPLRQLPNGNYLITIRVRGSQKARALATLLVPAVTIGNIRISVQVRTQQGTLVSPIQGSLTPSQIAALYRVALRTNRLFSFVTVRNLPIVAVFPVFKAVVVQYFADNLADLYRNINQVAADVFRDVLRPTIGQTPIQFSTAQKQ
ncbi:hypothetical protein GE107_16085 [Cohnella sp. CFH 77786]|uniref:hypothetical protein n=1 Tax=Cohnella sp. CFH 77786 TaxID=2662265 RepID=UPI001C60DC7B|nr:hypothetical protein [Cohnella sp. CFH 77786]MBW5447577.1 hypothetical protein [Cohnella sp. CFH 77786]